MNAVAGTIYNAEELRRYRMEDSERDMLCFLYVHHTSGALHESTQLMAMNTCEYDDLSSHKPFLLTWEVTL